MKVEIFDKARLLGEEIASSGEFKRLQRAQANFDYDMETQERMQDIERLSQEINSLNEEFITLKQLESMKGEVALLKEQLHTTRAVIELQEAKNEFASFMDEVNQVVHFVITGEAADAHNGCSGCQGCHQVH